LKPSELRVCLTIAPPISLAQHIHPSRVHTPPHSSPFTTLPANNQAINNFEGAIKEIDVSLSVRGNARGKSVEAHHQRDQIVEVTVYTLRHGVIRVEDTEEDLYAAIDLVTDKLRRKIVKTKEKAVQNNTWPGRGGTKGGAHIEDGLVDADIVDALPSEVAQAAPLPAEIVREKILFLDNAMTPEEAVDQLEAVGHDFFCFIDSKDNAMKVVYRRRSHGYGLLIPTPGSA
jgi:putative sigma-54 modulation protein